MSHDLEKNKFNINTSSSDEGKSQRVSILELCLSKDIDMEENSEDLIPVRASII